MTGREARQNYDGFIQLCAINIQNKTNQSSWQIKYNSQDTTACLFSTSSDANTTWCSESEIVCMHLMIDW